MNLLQPINIYMRRLGSQGSRNSEESALEAGTCWIQTSITKKRSQISRPVLSLLIISTFGVVLWLSIAYLKIKNLVRNSPPSNDYSAISSLWQQPSDAAPLIEYFSDRTHTKLNPVRCHSHNDYWRKVPLFDAISYGCVSVEADVWLPLPPEEERIEFGEKVINIELQVGHTRDSLSIDKTLDSLYLGPLFHMLYNRISPDNNSTTGIFDESTSTTGIFDESPSTFVLLIDFKPSDNVTSVWHALQIHLTTFRNFGWLTHWDHERNLRVTRPLTIVATGYAPFEEIVASQYGDVFYDAPLDQLGTDDYYNTSNSYYASSSLSSLVGKLGPGRSLSSAQVDRLEAIFALARAKGLVSRVWGTPAWPVSTRNKVWEQVLQADVGVLNVDEFGTATKKDWRLCKVLGIELCT